MSEPERLPSKMRELLYDEDRLEGYHQWRISEGAAINPIMGVETVFDKQRAGFVRPRPFRALEECLSSIQDPEITNIIGAGKCDWDTVIQARDIVLDKVEEAKNNYSTRGNNPIRHLGRQGGALAGTVEPLLGMIPDLNGLSVLRGGLLTIFKILQQRDANRETIFRAFEDIPNLVVKAQEAHQLFPTESKIQNEVVKFYETLLEEIPKLIDLLLHRNRQTIPGRILKYLPQHEARDIDDCVQRVTSVSRSLDFFVESITRKTSLATHRNTVENIQQTQAVRQTLHTTDCRLYHIEEQNNDMRMQLANIEQSMNQLNQEVRDKHTDLRDNLLAQIVLKYVYHVATEGEYERGILGPPPSYSPSPFPRQPFRVTINQLFAALDVPYLGPTEDLETVLAQSKIIEVQALGRARSLMVEDGFKAWLAPNQNDFLLVDGYGAGLGNRKTTPLSVFCASLAVAMTQVTTFMSLTYFCGEHFSSLAPLSGPSGILRSLIVQLFQYSDLLEPKLDFIDEEFFDQISQHNIVALSDLFHLLVEQVGKDVTVYCIIDNISELEGTSPDWSDALRYLVEELISITEDERIQATFKLLVTCRHKSVEVVHLIPKEKHIQLHAGKVHNQSMLLDAFADDVRSAMSSENLSNKAWEDAAQGSEDKQEQEVSRTS